MASGRRIQPNEAADGRGPTARAMSSLTTQSPNSARGQTWQPAQGIVFAAPSSTQKNPYATKFNKQGTKSVHKASKKSSLSIAAYPSPGSSNTALPLLPFRPHLAVSHPLPRSSVVDDVLWEDDDGLRSPDYADLESQLKYYREQERRKAVGVEGQFKDEANISFEDGPAFEAMESVESGVMSQRQQPATQLARPQADSFEWEVQRMVEFEKIRTGREEDNKVETEKRPRKVKAKKEAGNFKAEEKARNVEAEQRSAKRLQAQIEVANKHGGPWAIIETTEEREMPVARGTPNVSADNNNVTEHALRLNSSLAMDKPFYTAYTVGFAPISGKGPKPLIANNPVQTLLDKSKTTRAVSPVEKALEDEKVVLWQAARRRRPSLQEGEGDLSPLVLDKEYTNEKRSLVKAENLEIDGALPPLNLTKEDPDMKRSLTEADIGLNGIKLATDLLAADLSCSPHIPLACADINDEVKMLKMELERLGRLYGYFHSLRRRLTSEQTLCRKSLIRKIRMRYMEQPFRDFLRLARETEASYKTLKRFWARWGRESSRMAVQKWQTYDISGSFRESINGYFDIVRQTDARIASLRQSARSLDRLAIDSNRMIKGICRYWHTERLLHVPGDVGDHTRFGNRTLLLCRLRRALFRRQSRIRDNNGVLRILLGQCGTMVQRGLRNTTSSWTHSIRIIDDKNKDIGEADSSLSAQTSSGWGTLNLRPTTKLSSQCSAVALEDATGQALPTGAEAIDDVIDHTPMVYQIPEEVMREAMLASLNTRAAYWQYSLYQERGDPSGDKVKVHYCTSKETTEQIAQLFLDKEVVGFDIEWKPQAQFGDGIKKNVSLVQIASEERIALFHVGRYAKGDTIDDLLAPTLKKIMESSEIIKVGVSVKADCTRLQRFLGIEARGLFELSHLYKLIKYSAGDVKKINKVLVSLAQQVEEHLQLPMWKGDVRSSDWSQKLNYEQIKYAASDSYAGLRLYDIMEGKRKALKPTPPRPAHAELNLPIILANGKTVATYDEPYEVKDEKPSENISAQPADLEEMARDFFDIAIEDSERKPSAASKSAALGSKKSPEITAAETWVANWRSTLPPGYKPRATQSQLRAYALWSELGKEVSEAADILRDPPLQASTVASYIVEAIKLERLPFQDHRLKKVWELLPTKVPGRGWRPQGGKW